MENVAALLGLMTRMTVPSYGTGEEAGARDGSSFVMMPMGRNLQVWDGVAEILRRGKHVVWRVDSPAELSSSAPGRHCLVCHAQDVGLAHAAARATHVQIIISVASSTAGWSQPDTDRPWSLYLEPVTRHPAPHYTIYRGIAASRAPVARRLVRGSREGSGTPAPGGCLLAAYPREVAELLVAASTDTLLL